MAKTPKIDLTKFQKKLDEATDGFRKAGKLSVIIGLPADRIHQRADMSFAALGAIHEFGLGNVPERSFLRGTLLKKRAEIKKEMTNVGIRISKGMAPEVALEQLALWGQGLVQQFIADGKTNFVPLTPATVAAREKGGDNPLNDEGMLRQAVFGAVVND